MSNTYKTALVTLSMIWVMSCANFSDSTEGQSLETSIDTVAPIIADDITGSATADPDSILAAVYLKSGALEVDPNGFVTNWGPISSEQATIVEIGRPMVEPLVDCLSSTTQTGLTLNDNKITEGALCAALLMSVALHEPVDSIGDLDGSWSGFVDIRSSHDELLAGQSAWRDVVLNDRFMLRPL